MGCAVLAYTKKACITSTNLSKDALPRLYDGKEMYNKEDGRGEEDGARPPYSDHHEREEAAKEARRRREAEQNESRDNCWARQNRERSAM